MGKDTPFTQSTHPIHLLLGGNGSQPSRDVVALLANLQTLSKRGHLICNCLAVVIKLQPFQPLSPIIITVSSVMRTTARQMLNKALPPSLYECTFLLCRSSAGMYPRSSDYSHLHLLNSCPYLSDSILIVYFEHPKGWITSPHSGDCICRPTDRDDKVIHAIGHSSSEESSLESVYRPNMMHRE